MRKIAIASVATWYLVPLAANAALINIVTESGGAVLDTVNGMEWLDLSPTANLTPSFAVSLYAGSGWSWATSAQVSDLLDQFFLANGPDVPLFRPTADTFRMDSVSHAQFSAFADLFGMTPAGSGYTGGWYDDQVFDGNQEGIFWDGVQDLGGTTVGGFGDDDSTSLFLGTFGAGE